MTSPFGTPANFQISSALSTIVSQPGGAQRGQTPLNMPPGSALSGENYIVRDGALELRPALSQITTQATDIWTTKRVVGGGAEIQKVSGARQYFVFQYNQFAYYNPNLWLSSTSNNTVMQGDAQTRWDVAQIFVDKTSPSVVAQENALIATPSTQQAVFYVSDLNAGFNVLTSLIGAKRVAVFDNYVLVGNIFERSSALSFPQRIQWSDRGSASSWTGGLSGFEDLLAARGEIQRIIPLENRVIVLFDDETWQGLPSEYPFTFRFSPIDQGVGCPYPWTATATPRGVVFVGRDFQTYLLPKEGGPPQPIGTPIQRKLRSDITWPDRAFAVYDPNMQQYELFYSASTDSYPRNAAFMDMNSGAWSFQSFPVFLTTGFPIHDRTDRSNAVVPLLVSSTGTMYRLTSEYTQDALSGTTTNVRAYWEFLPFGGEAPPAQKSVTEIRVDYDGASASSLTVRTSPSQGDAFSTGVQLALPATSVVSQGIAYVREASRYPAVRIEQEAQRQRIHRVHTTVRIGGR